MWCLSIAAWFTLKTDKNILSAYTNIHNYNIHNIMWYKHIYYLCGPQPCRVGQVGPAGTHAGDAYKNLISDTALTMFVLIAKLWCNFQLLRLSVATLLRQLEL